MAFKEQRACGDLGRLEQRLVVTTCRCENAKVGPIPRRAHIPPRIRARPTREMAFMKAAVRIVTFLR